MRCHAILTAQGWTVPLPDGLSTLLQIAGHPDGPSAMSPQFVWTDSPDGTWRLIPEGQLEARKQAILDDLFHRYRETLAELSR